MEDIVAGERRVCFPSRLGFWGGWKEVWLVEGGRRQYIVMGVTLVMIGNLWEKFTTCEVIEMIEVRVNCEGENLGIAFRGLEKIR